jgi:hypothetical protein
VKANYQKPVYLGTCKKAVNGSGCDINENINISLKREQTIDLLVRLAHTI